jgi:hypothetical protein
LEERTSSGEMESVRLAGVEAYNVHAGELSRIAMVMTRNKALAQDLLADEGNWLRVVVRNLIMDGMKTLKAQDSVALEEVEGAAAKTPEEKELALSRAVKAARILAPRERECIKLRSQGLQYREIASARWWVQSPGDESDEQLAIAGRRVQRELQTYFGRNTLQRVQTTRGDVTRKFYSNLQ